MRVSYKTVESPRCFKKIHVFCKKEKMFFVSRPRHNNIIIVVCAVSSDIYRSRWSHCFVKKKKTVKSRFVTGRSDRRRRCVRVPRPPARRNADTYGTHVRSHRRRHAAVSSSDHYYHCSRSAALLPHSDYSTSAVFFFFAPLRSAGSIVVAFHRVAPSVIIIIILFTSTKRTSGKN